MSRREGYLAEIALDEDKLYALVIVLIAFSRTLFCEPTRKATPSLVSRYMNSFRKTVLKTINRPKGVPQKPTSHTIFLYFTKKKLIQLLEAESQQGRHPFGCHTSLKGRKSCEKGSQRRRGCSRAERDEESFPFYLKTCKIFKPLCRG
ncbi:hypothetical protein KSP39_PZI002122 [Platanthera zijinensis]|uniref:Uncharacterized protein n=1 Tax=Platanthera zijinensis TaxID=2320716 RepID=A0AAP0BYK4_9ASPA